MAHSTYKSFLMYSTDGITYNKLTDIKTTPDMGDEPEQLETTTLSDPQKTYTEGLQDNPNKMFDANYDPIVFANLQELAHQELFYAVWLGGTDVPGGKAIPTGEWGKFPFKGILSVWLKSSATNGVHEIAICIVPTTVVGFGGGVIVRLDKTNLIIKDGNTASLVATKEPNDATLEWNSSNTSVATVSSGTVTAVDPGMCVITCTATKGDEVALATCVVTVTE